MDHHSRAIGSFGPVNAILVVIISSALSFPALSSGSGLTLLYRFSSRAPGQNPRGMLVRGNDGDFYGTTLFTSDPDTGGGVVFKVTPDKTYTVLHSFEGADGYDPESGLALGNDGNFYGVTASGGQYNFGTIFKIDSSGTFTNLYQFTGGSDGREPYGRLLQASDGNFYGTTLFGGKGNGTIFQITPEGAFQHLFSFSGSFPNPITGLIETPDGTFWGATQDGGGLQMGYVYKFTSEGVFKIVHRFSGPDGAHPVGDLLLATDGNSTGRLKKGAALT